MLKINSSSRPHQHSSSLQHHQRQQEEAIDFYASSSSSWIRATAAAAAAAAAKRNSNSNNKRVRFSIPVPFVRLDISLTCSAFAVPVSFIVLEILEKVEKQQKQQKKNGCTAGAHVSGFMNISKNDSTLVELAIFGAMIPVVQVWRELKNALESTFRLARVKIISEYFIKPIDCMPTFHYLPSASHCAPPVIPTIRVSDARDVEVLRLALEKSLMKVESIFASSRTKKENLQHGSLGIHSQVVKKVVCCFGGDEEEACKNQKKKNSSGKEEEKEEGKKFFEDEEEEEDLQCLSFASETSSNTSLGSDSFSDVSQISPSFAEKVLLNAEYNGNI